MDIQWDGAASLMRVVRFATADDQEELVVRGTLRALVGAVLEMAPGQQQGLVLRASGPDGAEDYDADMIRELAANPGYTAVRGAFDTVDAESEDGASATGGGSAPADADAPRGPSGTPAQPPAEAERR